MSIICHEKQCTLGTGAVKTAFCNVLFSLALRFHIAKIVGAPRCASMAELENQLR